MVGTGSGPEGALGTPETARAAYQTREARTAIATKVRARMGGFEENSMGESRVHQRFCADKA